MTRAPRKKEMFQYFSRKVEKYRQQEKMANQSIDDAKFITKAWLMTCVGKACGSCGDCLSYSRSHGKISAT